MLAFFATGLPLSFDVPVLGNLFHLISLERFCRVLAALSKAGVPLPDAIQMSADSTNNTVFQAKMVDVRDTLVRGGGLAAPIVETGIFPVFEAEHGEVTAVTKIRRHVPVEEYLRPQKRFAHLFSGAGRPDCRLVLGNMHDALRQLELH